MFSDHEKTILEILGKKEMSISNITKVFYPEERRPMNGENYVAFVIRRIKDKCLHNKLDWTIEGVGSGRAGRTVWIERRRTNMIKRLAYKKEPILHVHNYVCQVFANKGGGSWFHYCANLKEVSALKKSLKEGQVMEVYRATHNFIKAYHCEK